MFSVTSLGLRSFRSFYEHTLLKNCSINKTIKMCCRNKEISNSAYNSNVMLKKQFFYKNVFSEKDKAVVQYTRKHLLKLRKTELPAERYVFDIQKKPLLTYFNFYNNQFNSINYKEIVLKIIADINYRLESDVINSETHKEYKQILKEIRETGMNLLSKPQWFSSTVNRFNFVKPSDVTSFVLSYVEIMYELIKSHDKSIQGTYYTDFAKDFMKENLCSPGNNTQMFFTFKNLGMQYFIDTRPLCLYPVHLIDLPNFSSEEPLISTKEIKGHVESKLLDFREVTYHDIGHAHVMSRQDRWLFDTCNENPVALVTEWLRNKDWYMQECSKLKNTNYLLYQAVKLYLFDITHDRGYQFYLPIIKQQLKAIKNLENLKSRIIRGEFDINYDRTIVDHINEAREWLLDVTNKFIIKDNIDKIAKYKNIGYIIKKYPDVESHAGVPINVTLCKNGKILVDFDSEGIIKTTSIYEIELISIPVEDKILNEDKLNKINTWLNSSQNCGHEFIKLDVNGDVLNTSIKNQIRSDAAVNKCLKKIEIFKLERLLKLIKNKSNIKFSISKLPDVYETNEFLVNPNGDVTIDTGLFFKINEIGIEKKSKSTLKYINLNPNDRFVQNQLLRDSYIKDSNNKNPQMKPYVTINDELELGIVDTKKHVELAKAVSSLLSRSIDNAKDIYGGYLPPKIVERAQLEYVSPYALSNLWGKSCYRFVLSRKINSVMREIIGTALIASSDDTLLFFTNKYNNLKFSTIKNDVDFNLSVDGKHKWFEKFAMPEIQDYKPLGYNQLANFAIERINCRGIGLGKLLINEIEKNYSYHNLNGNLQHSQPLIHSKGLFQIADPSWKKYMLNIGFKLRYGAETFYLDREWDKLTPININGKEVSNVAYNRMYGIPQFYERLNLQDKNTSIDLRERIPQVIKLANSGNAKLQYFQMLYTFNDRNL